MPPFEHMLRNAVAHGIENRRRSARSAARTRAARITIALHREGSEVVVEVSDDGAGMNLKAIRDKGISLGMVRADQQLSDEDIMQLILEPGFSTAGAVSTLSGRGVGMDVVASEIKKLGGALHMETKPGEGSRFTIRLPLTLAISHALILRANDELYALPLPTVEGVVRLSRAEVEAHLGPRSAAVRIRRPEVPLPAPGVLRGPRAGSAARRRRDRAGDPGARRRTLHRPRHRRARRQPRDRREERRVRRSRRFAASPAPRFSATAASSSFSTSARWCAPTGASRTEPVMPREKTDTRVVALVVDDSITVRRVTQRLLERNGMRVLTARDGVDAMEMLQEHTPDIILLDIEMPRMDGYEVATQVRADPRLSGIPIIMITSRVGEKHRARAIEIGVDDYLGKPYQEAQLLEAIEPLIARRRERASAGG